MSTVANRSRQQVYLAAATLAGAAVLLGATWIRTTPSMQVVTAGNTVTVALVLAAAVAMGYRYPIHVTGKTKIFTSTVPLYLAAVLLPPAIAGLCVLAGIGVGEASVRAASGGVYSDVTTQMGRLTLVTLAASLVAHIEFLASGGHAATLVTSAIVMSAGDILTSPILLSPITGETPLAIIRLVAKEAGATEASHYLIGMLGALAVQREKWALALLILPTALVYLAFKTAKDMHENARQLLVSVVETSPEAIMLLDLNGEIILANRQAEALQGVTTPDEMQGTPIFDLFQEEHREPAVEEFGRVRAGQTVTAVEHSLMREGMTPFAAELTWSLVTGKDGTPRAISVVIRDITQRKDTERNLKFRALHDALTGLPNRVLFRQELDELIQRGRDTDTSFALFQMDLNRFKQVNDTYGHQYGDLLLKEVAQRLRHVLRDSDTVARLGGDEFAVVLPKAVSAGASLVAGRIEESIAEPIVIEGTILDVGVSIGIALYPDHGAGADELLHHADIAMYETKRAYGGHTFYDPARATMPEVNGRERTSSSLATVGARETP